jgi:NAD(P)H-hydrate epimerase
VLPVLTPEEMAEADRRTIASGTPLAVLVERAGRAVAWSIRRNLGRAAGLRVVVARGKGNNGGDGLVAARVLRGWGARVEVVRVGEGVDRSLLARAVDRADVLVDAMYGTGFRGELAGDALAVCDAFWEHGGPVVAVDIPSGVDGLTGTTRGAAVDAAWTVTFAAAKPGLFFEPGRTLAGDVEIVDIGIETHGGSDAQRRAFVTEDVDVFLAWRWRAMTDHKWASGALVVGGSGGMTGAPMLASRAALRAGAGIVWCALPGDAAARASGTEVITTPVPADVDGALVAEAAATVLDRADRFRAVAIGPGLGRGDDTAAAVRRIVAECPRPLVIDADALHALGGHLGLLAARTAPTVLTPHAGEFAALAGEPAGDDRLGAARALAAATGAVVLLKGPGTVVAHPDGAAAICPIGGPGLATAGTGDVLTGIVTAFVARGSEPFAAAYAAAHVHAFAADTAGHTGLVAGDLVRALPATLDALGARG